MAPESLHLSVPSCSLSFWKIVTPGHSLTTVRYSQAGKDSPELPQMLAARCLNAPAIRIMSLLRAQLEILVLL